MPLLPLSGPGELSAPDIAISSVQKNSVGKIIGWVDRCCEEKRKKAELKLLCCILTWSMIEIGQCLKTCTVSLGPDLLVYLFYFLRALNQPWRNVAPCLWMTHKAKSWLHAWGRSKAKGAWCYTLQLQALVILEGCQISSFTRDGLLVSTQITDLQWDTEGCFLGSFLGLLFIQPALLGEGQLAKHPLSVLLQCHCVSNKEEQVRRFDHFCLFVSF